MANETMVLLEKIVVPSAGASSITFTSIPQSYTDLQITMSSRVDAANGVAQLYFNGSTASDKRWLRVYGDGSSAISGNSSGLSQYFRPIGINRSDQTASTFGNMSIYIPNYTSTSTYKSMSADGVNENNATFAEAALNAGLWESNSAITSITIIPSAGNFVQYSTFYLYGVAKQGVTPTNAPAATGGDSIVFDGTYWYHVFTSTGTFTPKKALTADCLVIAGGGAGSGTWGAGGGAGGLQYTSSVSFTSGTNYTTTVGGGASYASQSTVQGSNSNITGTGLSLTAAVGGGGAGSRVGAQQTGGNGGSGGGAVGNYGASTNAGGTATSGQGNNGGSASNSAAGMAGGGGAGGAGGNASGSTNGAGGIGSSAYSSWGSATSTGQNSGGTYYYAGGGGGGGGSNPQTNGGAAGLGGGGAGANGNNSGAAGAAGVGTANTGGGGGGGGQGTTTDSAGGNGGSGIIIVRYAA